MYHVKRKYHPHHRLDVHRQSWIDGFPILLGQNAIRINEERFEQLIYQALSGTVEQLEKGETSDVLLSKLIQDPALQQSLFQKIEPIEVKIGKQKKLGEWF